MCSNLQPESVQYGFTSSQICTVETQGEVPSLLEPPLSPLEMKLFIQRALAGVSVSAGGILLMWMCPGRAFIT